MANISTIRPDGNVKVPTGYPIMPSPDKIRLLYDSNSRALYHKLSPYDTETFVGIKTRQPFVYKYPDDKMGSMEKYASREFPFTRAITDVQRVSKWMVSQQGIIWAGKQFLLQTGNAFNETRVWNPTSPILGAALPLSLWALRPQRNIDTSGLAGVLNSVLGGGLGKIFSLQTPPPPGTIAGGLPDTNKSGGKGLLRAGTANVGLAAMNSKWTVSSTKGLGLGGFLSGVIKGLFGNFLPQRQSGVQVRSDEGAYGMMLGSRGIISYQGATTMYDDVNQMWFAGGKAIRKNAQVPIRRDLFFISENGIPTLVDSYQRTISGLTGDVGFSEDAPANKAVRYGDYIGIYKNLDWADSALLLQYSYFIEEKRKYPSKQTDKINTQVEEVNRSLQKVIDDINAVGNYTVKVTDPDSQILMTGQQTKIGYDRIAAKNFTDSQKKLTALANYRGVVRVLENQHTDNIKDRSLKMASTRQFDGINTLTVLDGDKKIKTSLLTDWTEWNPYKDDIIAFYFYDLVNDKYIPFRATVKGLQESISTSWEELSFIGRADRLYSYGGFNRSLTFNFTVNISSILELAPTWQRLNYLMSLSKPASYTRNEKTGTQSGLYSRYMVPPMVLLTIGDMYKHQPIVLASTGCSIPDSAVWETLNAENSEEWHYMADYIKSPKVGKKYGQLPRTAEISINAYLLEKERAVVGSAHFGHAPHTEDYTKDHYRKTAPNYQEPNDMDKAVVVYNDQNQSVKPLS